MKLHSAACGLLLTLGLASTSLAEAAEPAATVEKALTAVGGKDKLLKIFRMQETFHFGEAPEPPAGKTRSRRASVIALPRGWWLGQKERGDEPAKEDVRAWALDLLTDANSKIELLPDFTDEGRTCTGLLVSGSVEPAMKLWFDKETLLLKRLDWRKDYYRFSEWREVDGLKYPSRTVIFTFKTDKPWFYHDITGIERLTALPPGLVMP